MTTISYDDARSIMANSRVNGSEISMDRDDHDALEEFMKAQEQALWQLREKLRQLRDSIATTLALFDEAPDKPNTPDTPAPAAPVPAPTPPAPAAPAGITAHISSVRRDQFYSKTANAYRPMYRCTSYEGYEFNVFDHTDPLRDTYRLFRESGYNWSDLEPDNPQAYEYGTAAVVLERDGNFWKVLSVSAAPVAPVAPAPAAGFDDDDDFDGDDDDDEDGYDYDDEEFTRDDYESPRRELIKCVKSGKFVVLDTETTGLGNDAEICQIAIIDSAGDVLLDTLVKPVRPIPADATRIHGITNEMVADAPRWSDINQRVWELTTTHPVIIYNADYDMRLIRQSEAACLTQIASDWWMVPLICAMQAFAEIYGDWDEYNGSYRWKKLAVAAEHYGITPSNAHSALGDCRTTLAVVNAMAQQEAAE